MQVKKRNALAVAALLLCLLCGCSATELEDRCFPMMAAIDKVDGQITFCYGFPQLSQKDNTDMQEANVNAAMTSGESLAACMQAYHRQLEKLADCNHMKVLVLGKRLVQDKAAYGACLSYLKETEAFPRNTYVCVTDDVDQLFSLEENLSTDLGSYLEEYLKNHEDERQIALLNLGRLLDERENRKLSITLPDIEEQGGSICWEQNFRVES